MQIIIHDLSARTGNSVTFDGIGGSNGVYVVRLVYTRSMRRKWGTYLYYTLQGK